MRLILALALLLPSFLSQAQEPDKHDIFKNMMASIDKIKTLTFKLDKSERIGGKMVPGSQTVKVQAKPFKTYVLVHVPDKGAEVLYIEGENNGNAKVSPNKFPFMTLNLDPEGSILRNNQHHSVRQLGFEYTGKVLKHVYDQYKDKMEDYVQIHGEVNYDGRKCWNVTLTNKQYALNDYTVKAGENVIDIARKTHTNEYELLELNKLSGYDKVKAGQVIKVPNTYCKKIEMYIDQQNHLPIYQKMYDANGLIAVYEYKNLKINPPIKPEEFTTTYEGYKF
jgi:outer membrane lipoprotein-sorting protein